MAPVAALAVATAVLRRAPGAVVLVDGRSGSGKTTFAAALARRTRASLLRLEELYPGWDGLDAGSAAVAALLASRVAGGPAVARTWDWAADRAGRPVRLPAAGPLVVEGCGALSRGAAALAGLRVWVELADEERRTRALSRDGEVFAPHWDRWARQELRFLAREDPRRSADLHVDGRDFPQQVFSDRTGNVHYPRRP